jgi:xyloglucan-specific exo-beta-1,4-glucanase
MRITLAKALAAAALAAATLVVPNAAPPPASAAAPAAETYSWRNVEIAGGGFVPGIIFNRTEPNLIYSRTDIGGAYRWNQSTGRWVPLLDWVGWNNWGYNGVVSLATDAVDPNRVYVAAGMYTNSWDPNNGAILRSTDRGANWQVSPLPFKLGGNMPGRGMGERLAVDPNDNRVLYFGAPDGNGLWRSTNAGVSWSRVTSFPNAGNWAQDPSDPNGYLSHRPGVVWVSFDKSSGTAGSPTRAIYAGVADLQNTVYRSTDAGATWTRIAGQPTGYMAHKGVLDEVNHQLYIATSNTGGPYDGAKGDVWKYNTTTGAWTQISPIPSSSGDDYFGYSGLTIDRQRPNTIMVATQVSWWPDAIFFRSTDGGATWTRIWDWTSYPNRSFRYTMNVSSSPWLTFGTNPQPPEVTPKLGWMNESVEIDPHNSNRLMYGTGATVYGTTNLTAWDANQQITIRPMAAGLEETAVLDLVSPPSGAPLVSGLGDIGGFRHNSLTTVPQTMFTQPVFTSTTSLDFAERSPNVMVRAGNFNDADRPNDSHVAFSTDGGSNWFQGTEPGGINEGGTVAAAADGSRFVWAPRGQPVHYSVGFGNSWTQTQGLPTESVVESDRVNANKFYGFNGGRFYVSTNGGATFTQTAATGLPSTAKFKAVQGRDGDIWLAGDTGIFHSTNSGASFTKLSTVTKAVSIGFGAAAPGQTYPALYAMATVGGVTGVYRSDNAGAAWVRINDDRHQYGNAGDAITGDPRVYGRVYLGTNGRGIIYGDRTATAATTAAEANTTTEKLDRGLISVRSDKGNFVSWRLLTSDPTGVAFTVYRDGTRVAQVTGVTSWLDEGAPEKATYSVRPVVNGAEQRSASEEVTPFATSMDVPLQIPPGGTTPSGEAYTYSANDTSVGDLDGDGQYEIVVKWDPSNAKDNSQSGYTGNVYLDAYKLNGTRLWRIDLGRNIRAGAHYTQFQVFDYDGDGRAEVAVKTADATRSGTGQVIGNANADHRNSSGYVLAGPEFLSVFRGTDGAVLATADYVVPRGTVSSWGDNYGNRVDRFLAGTAYVDGSRPSIIMARGYYTRSVVVAWDFRNGALTRRWTFDSNSSTNGSAWTGKGNHQLSIADVDADGRDEILYGSMAIDDNGFGLWQNNTQHGDAYHVGDLIPSRAGLEVFKPSESGSNPAHWMGDARTGQIIWSAPSCGCDNGRGVAADIWSGSAGAEAWSSAVAGLRSGANGNQVAARKPSSTNFVIWWDGDAQRELLDGTHIDKYGTSADTRLLTGSGVASNNGTKATPALSADILGDWREEVIWRTSDNRALRIYSTTDSTNISRPSLMQDRQYRVAIAWQNTAYNQPPHPSFAIG